MSVVDSRGKEIDPFATGVWIYCVADGKSMLALIEESIEVGQVSPEAFERDCQKELVEHRSLAVTLKRKYVLNLIAFPSKQGNQILPAFMLAPARHETVMELEHDFPTLAVLHSVTFLSAFHPDDQDRWRQFVKMADASQAARAQAMRAQRSGIVVAGGAGNGGSATVR